MGRGFLFMAFFLGLFAAMMSNCSSGMSSRRPLANAEVVTDGARVTFKKPNDNGRSTGTFNDGSVVELQRNSDGHFYADVQINGAPVHMLVDTGATTIALSRDDARAAGLATSIGMNDVVGEGADGAVHGEYVKLDNVTLGGASASGLEAVVLNGGSQSLLGQEFLAKFDSVEIHGDTMVLK